MRIWDDTIKRSSKQTCNRPACPPASRPPHLPPQPSQAGTGRGRWTPRWGKCRSSSGSPHQSRAIQFSLADLCFCHWTTNRKMIPRFHWGKTSHKKTPFLSGTVQFGRVGGPAQTPNWFYTFLFWHLKGRLLYRCFLYWEGRGSLQRCSIGWGASVIKGSTLKIHRKKYIPTRKSSLIIVRLNIKPKLTKKPYGMQSLGKTKSEKVAKIG